MKKQIALTLILVLVTCIICSCNIGGVGNGGSSGGEGSLWDSATYSESSSVGNGAKTFSLSIEAEGKAVTLTVNTNEEILGTALYSLGIINDPTFFDTANGITADWNKDNAYWAFYIGDTMASVGVGDVSTEEGAVYKFVYTK